MQANWPTTGAAGVVGPVVDVVVVDVVVDVDVEDVDVVVGAVVDVVVAVVDVVVVVDVDAVEDDVAVAVVGEVLDVGAGASVSSTDSLAGADGSVRVVHPAASATVSSTDVTIEYRRPPTNGRDLTRTFCPRSTRTARRATPHHRDLRRIRSRP